MKQLLPLFFFMGSMMANAQNIGIGTNSPNSSAQLDVESSTRGLLIPRMTSSQRNAIGNPAQGLMVYDSTERSFYFRRGNSWQRIYDNASPIFPNAYAGSWPANLILSLENTSISTGSSISVIYSVNRGAGPGVWGNSETGNGVRGTSGGQYGVYGESADSIGGYFTSTSGKAALVTGNGNVGIGTNYPYQARFVITSPLPNNSMAVIGQGTGGVSIRAGGSPSIGLNTYTVAGVNRFMSASGYGGSVDFNLTTGDLGFRVTNATSGGTDQSAAAATQTMVLTRTGQLGIGNITPAYALDVNGRARLRHNTITAGLWLNKSDNTEGAFVGMVNDTTAGFWGNATSGNWRMVVDVKNAQVGIGTTDPVSPLSFANATGNKISVWNNANGTQYGIGLQGGLMQIYSDASSDDIAFGYGNSASFTENMRIKGNGNVGIGVSNPTSKLVVESGGIGIAQQSPDGGTRVGFFTIAGSAFLQTHTNHALNFATNNGGSQMTLATNGNLGIGTVLPAAKLDVNGTIKISGGSPGTGRMLTSDASGVASWKDPVAKSTSVIVFSTNLGRADSTQKIKVVGSGAFATKLSEAVLFQKEVLDDNALFNDSVYTAPQTGVYQVNVNINVKVFQPDLNYDGATELVLVKNNSQYMFSIIAVPANPLNWDYAGALSGLVSLNAGDKLKIAFDHHIGSNYDLTVYPGWCSLSINRVY